MRAAPQGVRVFRPRHLEKGLRSHRTDEPWLEETASTLLDVFVPDENDQCCSDWPGPLNLHNTVDESEIKNAIWQMKPARSPGKDGKDVMISQQAYYGKHGRT